MPNVKKRAEKDCPTCGKRFVCARPTQHFCSRKCIRLGGRDYPICPCGKQTQSYMQKYCCVEHRQKWGKKREPVRVIAYTCQECKQVFERPWFYPGKLMFCSIACSNMQHSRKRARHYQFGDLNLNSSFELRFVACLERLMIEWSPWPDDRPFVHDGHEYRPDFLVSGRAVETKGWDANGQAEIRKYWNFPEPLVVVDRDRLIKLEHVFNRQRFVNDLSAP